MTTNRDAVKRDAVSLTEVLRIIETYEVSVGNSAAGEIACEMTMANLKDIRDAITALPTAPAADSQAEQATGVQDERDQFEAWARTCDGNCNDRDLEQRSDGDYKNMLVQRDWEVWQARAASTSTNDHYSRLIMARLNSLLHDAEDEIVRLRDLNTSMVAQGAEPVAEVQYGMDMAYAQWLIDAPVAGTKLYAAPLPRVTATVPEGFAPVLTDEQIESARNAADKECPLGPVNIRWYRAFARALLASKPAVPEGWKLVPVKPTQEQINSGYFGHNNIDVYRRMLAAAPTALAQSCGDAEQADAPQAKTVPFVMCLDDVVEMWNSVIADSFEDELIEFAAKAINFYKDSLPGSATPNAAEQADEAVTAQTGKVAELEQQIADLKAVAEQKDAKSKELGTMLANIMHDQTVAMQAALIEWKFGRGVEAGFGWIVNTLDGPGLLPDFDTEHGKNAQFWFDTNRAEPFPKCFCGNPSHQLWMGQGFCCNEHYAEAKAKHDAARAKDSK